MHFYSLILHLKKIYLTNRRNVNDNNNNNNNNNNHDGIFIFNKKITKTQRWLTAEVHPLFKPLPSRQTPCAQIIPRSALPYPSPHSFFLLLFFDFLFLKVMPQD